MEKLKWETTSNYSHVAPTNFGLYKIRLDEVCKDGSEKICVSLYGAFYMCGFKSVEIAKIAAQRDFELRQDAEAGRLGASDETCVWTQNNPYIADYWETGCGESFVFEDELAEGEAICRYCSACGKPVKLVKWVDKDEVGDG